MTQHVLHYLKTPSLIQNVRSKWPVVKTVKPAQNCTPSHTSSIQLSWFFKASWISPRRPENRHEHPTTSKHRLKSSQICPFLLGFLKPNPNRLGSHLFGPSSFHPTLPKAPMSKRIVEISAVIVACGCWELYPKMGRPQSIGSDESMSLQELYLNVSQISEKRLNHFQIHTGFTVSISSNTLDTHECNTTVPSSTRWRLVMMEWVASTRARISSKSTFTASIAAVKSCPQQWSLVAIPHIRKGAQKRLQNLEIGDNLGFLSEKIKCCLINLI